MGLGEFRNIVNQHLGNELETRGQFILSAKSTIGTPSKLVIYGLNPGQDYEKVPDHVTNCSMKKALEALDSQDESLLSSQRWLMPNGAEYPQRAPFQERTLRLLEELGQPNALVTNVCFYQTRAADEVTHRMIQQCWPVHEWLLERAKPNVIIAYGLKAAEAVRTGLRLPMWQGTLPSGHGNWVIRWSAGDVSWNRDVMLIALPHFSRYEPQPDRLATLFKSLDIKTA